MNGWRGKVAYIDLSSGSVTDHYPDESVYMNFMGGAGLAARLLYDETPSGADPLSAANVLTVMTGPITGVAFPGSGRVIFSGRSPQTGVWGESSMGGLVGYALKAAGYDGLLIRGAAQAPVYLHVTAEGITINDASDLWGHDTYETNHALAERLGKHAEVASIGQAGENLVAFAGINHRGNDMAARCGLGAAWGAKKLKAIAVDATGDIPIADKAGLGVRRRELYETYKNDWWIKILKSGGTAWGTNVSVDMNDIGVKNWSFDSPLWKEESDHITGQGMEAAGLVDERLSCYTCPIACRRDAHSDEPFMPKGAAPEYESVGALGSMLLVDDPHYVVKANDQCNRYGLDTISCGGTLAWAFECFDRGILTTADTGGLALRWGDGPMVVKLVDMIAHKQGFGAVLALGSRGAARKIGRGSEDYAIQVKGLEPAMHHPRAMHGTEISYATGARGASHNEGGGVHKPTTSLEERAGFIAEGVDRGMIIGSAVFCNFTVGPLKPDKMSAVLAAVTGHPYTPDELTLIGKRIWLMRRAYNYVRCGVAGEEDKLPKRWLEQIPDVDFPSQLAAYFRVRGLDSQGVPTPEALDKLGLGDVVPDLAGVV